MAQNKDTDSEGKRFSTIFKQESTQIDQQVEELQEKLEYQKDARKEDQFFFVVVCVILLNVVFFSVMPTLGGPLALLLLQLLILIPLARKMGMEEIATILSRVIDRIAGKS